HCGCGTWRAALRPPGSAVNTGRYEDDVSSVAVLAVLPDGCLAADLVQNPRSSNSYAGICGCLARATERSSASYSLGVRSHMSKHCERLRVSDAAVQMAVFWLPGSKPPRGAAN